MKPQFIFLAIIFNALFADIDRGWAEIKTLPAVGEVIFVKGMAIKCTDRECIFLKPGFEILDKDILEATEGAKIQLMLTHDKALVTIISGAKAKIKERSAEQVSGPKGNVIIKELGFMQPVSGLDRRFAELAGDDSIKASLISLPEPLNLKNTFTREIRPTFRLGGDQTAGWRIALYLKQAEGARVKLWEKRLGNGDIFLFPKDEPNLERGHTYCWELLGKDGETVGPCCFYLLSQTEEEAMVGDLAGLESLSRDKNNEKSTLDILKSKLLKKYHLQDELKSFVLEMRAKYPDNEAILKIIETGF